MEKKLNCFLKTSYLQITLGIILVILCTIGALLFLNSTQKAEDILTERVKLREFILARAGSTAISDFFEARKMKLVILASVKEIKTLDVDKSRIIAQKLIEEMKDRPITAIGVLDKKGIFIWSQTRQNQKIDYGADFSDRSYFQWAKNQETEGNVFVSEPMISRTGDAKGTPIVMVATPLFNNNQFNGVLFMVIEIKDLMEKFVTPLTVSPKSIQMIVTGDGLIVASSIEESVGMNISKEEGEKANNIKGLSGLVKTLSVDQDGSLVTELTYPGGKPVKMILGYSPIKTKEIAWYLWVSVPYTEVIDQLYPFSTTQYEGLILLSIALIVLIIFDILIMRIAERQGYRNGYSACLVEGKKNEIKNE
jgi:hypothetical protein